MDEFDRGVLEEAARLTGSDIAALNQVYEELSNRCDAEICKLEMVRERDRTTLVALGRAQAIAEVQKAMDSAQGFLLEFCFSNAREVPGAHCVDGAVVQTGSRSRTLEEWEEHLQMMWSYGNFSAQTNPDPNEEIAIREARYLLVRVVSCTTPT